ncbi:MAG: HlyD family secretion protein [Alkalispirochaeta sp.]
MLTSCTEADTDVIQGSGTIEATEVTISARTNGELLEVNVRRGDEVDQGEVLARVDATDLELQLTQGRYRLEAARAERDTLLAGAREEEIQQAEANLREARDARDLAERTLERIRNLRAAGSSTASELDRAETRYLQARSRAEAAEAQLQRLETLVRPEDRRRANAQVAEAETAVSRLERHVSDATISAPRAGTITVVVREVGEMVAPGTPLLVLADLSIVFLTIYVPERRLGEITIGGASMVQVDGMPDREFPGTITAVAERAEFTPRNVQTEEARAQLVYAVEITLENPDGVFKIGMPATAKIVP